MEPSIADDEAAPQGGIAYVICSMSDIPSQRARGFQLMQVAEDGTEQPFNIVVVRWGRQVFGYLNVCPHDKVNLDWERNQFLDPNGIRLMCGKHGALFELGTGVCLDGPCKGKSLTPVALSVIDNDICVTGVTLAEEEDDDEDEAEITSCSDEGGGV
ncbi:Rieske 2Fe-2S domain-containing protein [Xanthobacter sp. V3C-3]|uniref:Rieske (2Fe-2S) protein n=1 Tax=Xanthobacter lutulentifluminis TaxID=3119935 RepID=UPI00372C1FD4